MDLTEQIDIYCERVGPEFWSEPINALTNAAFLLAAIWSATRLRGTGLQIGWALAVILFAIGIGSFLFHSFATVWAALADVIPISLFVLVYAFAIHRDMLGFSPVMAAAGALATLPYIALAAQLFGMVPFFEISAAYWPIALGIVLYGFALGGDLRRGLWIGAALLCLSLLARSSDMAVCSAISVGTHFLWHILNAIMLAWMIELYRRHMLAGGAGRG